MKKIVMTAVLFIQLLYVSAQRNDWENPQLIDQNKEKPHATFMLFNKVEDVKADEYRS